MPRHTATAEDALARSMWGAAFDQIPKSLFAIVAWNQSSALSADPGRHGAAADRFLDELRGFADAGAIDRRKVTRVARALARTDGGV